MKIAVACATIGVVHRGGELQLTWMMQELARLGHETTIFAGGDVPVGGPARVVVLRTLRPAWERLLIQRPRTGHALARADRWQFALRAYAHMARLHPDVVIPVEPPLHERLARRFVAGAKLVSFGLGGPAHDARRVAEKPDLFVVSSPRAQKGPNCVVIPPGVDLAAFSPDGETQKLDLPRPIVGVFGALIPCKRILLAVEAVKRMQGSLLVVGAGPEKARIVEAAKELGARFRLLDQVAAAEVPPLMRAIDVLCFPANEEETFGMVLVEAMALRKPVVASDDEVRRWIIGDAGELCDVTNAELLAQTLSTAATRRYPARAEKFSWQAAAKSLDKSLRELLTPGVRQR